MKICGISAILLSYCSDDLILDYIQATFPGFSSSCLWSPINLHIKTWMKSKFQFLKSSFPFIKLLFVDKITFKHIKNILNGIFKWLFSQKFSNLAIQDVFLGSWHFLPQNLCFCVLNWSFWKRVKKTYEPDSRLGSSCKIKFDIFPHMAMVLGCVGKCLVLVWNFCQAWNLAHWTKVENGLIQRLCYVHDLRP